MLLKKNIIISVVFTVLTVMIGISSVLSADMRHGAKQ